jgi:transcription elongation factor Elf1
MWEFQEISESEAKSLCAKDWEYEANFICGLCGWLELEYFNVPNTPILQFRCKRCGNKSVKMTYLSKTHLMMDPPESIYSKWLKDGMPGVVSVNLIESGELKLTCRKGHDTFRNFNEEDEFRCHICGNAPVERRVVIEIFKDN